MPHLQGWGGIIRHFFLRLADKGRDVRKIFKPILEPDMERWFVDNDMEPMVKALLGVR